MTAQIVLGKHALATLRTIREPSETMLRAGFDAVDPVDAINQLGDVWRAMIDQLINETEARR